MTLRIKFLAAIVACAAVSGCVTAEGISLGTEQPYISAYFVKYGSLPDAALANPVSKVNELILVGTLSAYREIAPENAAKEHKKYVESFETWEAGRPPNLSLDEFSTTISGWTQIKVSGVPLIYACYVKSLVSSEILRDADFEPAVATFLLQTSSDLVAARTNSDGAFVIEAVLCRDQPGSGYTECASGYKKGVFDAATGRKVKGKMEVSEKGPQIDTLTYRVIEPHTDERKASNRVPQ